MVLAHNRWVRDLGLAALSPAKLQTHADARPARHAVG
jgi:hypothetical protein